MVCFFATYTSYHSGHKVNVIKNITARQIHSGGSWHHHAKHYIFHRDVFCERVLIMRLNHQEEERAHACACLCACPPSPALSLPWLSAEVRSSYQPHALGSTTNTAGRNTVQLLFVTEQPTQSPYFCVQTCCRPNRFLQEGHSVFAHLGFEVSSPKWRLLHSRKLF